MAFETYPTRAYRVSLSDRKNRRTVQAATPGEAIGKAVGARFYSRQQDYYLPDTGYSAWRVLVATAKPQNGFTPVREILAYVETL